MSTLGPVTAAHRVDEARLTAHLADAGFQEFRGTVTVSQYQGGQSNPTYKLDADGAAFVLRKKPPGRLLPSAHMVEREHRVMAALESTDVPVPRMLHLCEDPAVIGTPFFLMEHIEGRVIEDPRIEGAHPEERAAIYDAMSSVLAALHRVDWEAVGLGDFGKPDGYVARQVARWTKQYEASRTDPIPEMDRLIEWLPEHLPSDEEVTIAHGDFRLGNLIIHPTEPRVLAVIDWELSTLGHPLADLAFNCMTYHMEEGSLWKGLGDASCTELGIPTEEEYVVAYCHRTGRTEIPEWDFFMALSFFRLASICQGVMARALQGNASSRNAIEVGSKAPELAATGWRFAERAERRMTT